MTLLEKGLGKLGLEVDDDKLSLLTRYIDEIELFNPAYGLVKVKDRDELIVKHILDSLAPLTVIRNYIFSAGLQGKPERINIADVGSGAGLQGKPGSLTVADIGSGAGLPGIPLAIYLQEFSFSLIERMGRRAGFLRNTIAVLKLCNVKVEEADVSNFGIVTGDRTQPFNLIVYRAFKPLDNDLLVSLFSLLAPNGIIAAYKGRKQSIDDEMKCLKAEPRLKFSFDIQPLQVPFLNEERHVLFLTPVV